MKNMCEWPLWKIQIGQLDENRFFYYICYDTTGIIKKWLTKEIVEKRKISYFGLARNLIQHWISPNQDDLSYSARTFISG